MREKIEALYAQEQRLACTYRAKWLERLTFTSGADDALLAAFFEHDTILPAPATSTLADYDTLLSELQRMINTIRAQRRDLLSAAGLSSAGSIMARSTCQHRPALRNHPNFAHTWLSAEDESAIANLVAALRALPAVVLAPVEYSVMQWLPSIGRVQRPEYARTYPAAPLFISIAWSDRGDLVSRSCAIGRGTMTELEAYQFMTA